MEERLGPAAETLETLLADPAQHGSYDFAFIDADKKVQSADMVVVVFQGVWVVRNGCSTVGRLADSDGSSGGRGRTPSTKPCILPACCSLPPSCPFLPCRATAATTSSCCS